MKRVNTKPKRSKEKKLIQKASSEAVYFLIRMFYVAMIDCGIPIQKVRAVKRRVDRYSKYIAEDKITIQYVNTVLKEAGFNVEDEI